MSDGYSVPRLQKLSYLEIALRGVQSHTTFDNIRQQLFLASQKREGQASSVVTTHLQDSYTYWSPTQEALSELMKIGFVVTTALPSARKYVEQYRNAQYELTPAGQQAVALLLEGSAKGRAKLLAPQALPGVSRAAYGYSNEPLHC